VTFTYEVENENDEVVKTYTVEATFTEDVPGFISGRPERSRPDEGGELEDLAVYLGNKDVTHQIDDDLYFKIRKEATERCR
jgi:hypothetical protein